MARYFLQQDGSNRYKFTSITAHNKSFLRLSIFFSSSSCQLEKYFLITPKCLVWAVCRANVQWGVFQYYLFNISQLVILFQSNHNPQISIPMRNLKKILMITPTCPIWAVCRANVRWGVSGYYLFNVLRKEGRNRRGGKASSYYTNNGKAFLDLFFCFVFQFLRTLTKGW